MSTPNGTAEDAGKSRFGVTSADLRRYGWQALLAQHPQKDCWSYCDIFINCAKECEATGDVIGRQVYALLNVVASFHPNYDSTGNPYGPMWSNFNGQRSLMAEDLADDDLQALNGILEEIEDPEYRARIGDVLWETRRDYKAAQIAVIALLESAHLLKTDGLWTPYTTRLERAAQLSARLGFGKPLHNKVIATVKAAINEFEGNLKSGLLCHCLMTIAFKHDAAETTQFAALSEKLAASFEAEGNSDFSAHYWQLAINWHRKAKNAGDLQRCQLAEAECLVAKAEKSLVENKLGASYAAHWMGRGLEALRQAKANPKRINEIHRRFLDLERMSLADMKPLNPNFDMIPGFRESEKKVQEAAIEHVRGFDFEHAVVRLASITRPIDTVEIRKQMNDQKDIFIWDKLVGSVALDHSGKVADTQPPVGFLPSNAEEIAMRKKMVQHAKLVHWPLEVMWKIEPARITILREHAIRQRDLFWLVADNPFIPPGHEGIYLRGIQAGFFGDWISAMHYILPQIEASIRHVLQQNGIVTSTLEADETQNEHDLNQLLWMPDLEKIFGPDIIFDLRGILIERFGYNMRNEVAHGLMPVGAFYQSGSVYLWWLVLHLCWIGYRLVKHVEDPPELDVPPYCEQVPPPAG